MGGSPGGTGLAALRGLRVRAGLSQADLAQRAGLSVRTLRALETGGVGRPRATSLHRLATALGVTTDVLVTALGWTEPENTANTAVRVRVGVLGPLALWHDGTAVPIASSRQRLLLGLLAAQPGRVVSVEQIVDVLWAEDPPRTGAHLVHTYVAQLRRLLEPDRAPGAAWQRLRRESAGYRLDLTPDQLDLLDCHHLRSTADAAIASGTAEAAWQSYTEAWQRWRGPALADTPPQLRQHPAVLAIARGRIDLAVRRADVAFELAHYDKVIGALQQLTDEEPLHEGLAARLMVALAGSGEQARALALFETVRRRLDDQLGVVPGPELRDAHLRVVRGQLPALITPQPSADSRPSAVPAQLPNDLDGFVGRAADLAALDALLNDDRPGARTALATVTGMGGIGKTALVVHWAHRVRDRFPGGQLYLDLRGHSTQRPLRASEALGYFLGGLGVPADGTPTDQTQAAALYRSKLADRPLLIVLDNAADADQVRPLLPGGRGCLVLVTSRQELGGLIARDGATLVPLTALPSADALALFASMLGAHRVARERPDLAELTRLCACLPLALRLAAANLALRPQHSARDYASRLTEDRLAALALAGDPDTTVRATFRLSVDALPPAERRLFRRLGLAPGADFAVDAAAVLADADLAIAEHLLGRLVSGHLVTESTPGRYVLHDLLRWYARELADTEETDADRAAAELRLADHAATSVEAAAELLYPHLLQLPNTVPPAQNRFITPDDALSWLDTERANLVLLADQLVLHGHYRAAWRLAHAANGYFFVLRRDANAWEAMAGAGAAAAWAGCGLVDQAMAELQIGMVAIVTGAVAESVRRNTRSVELAEQAGWTEGRAVALNNLARGQWLVGDVDRAIDTLTEALRLHQRTTRVAGQAVTLANLADAYAERGRNEDGAARRAALTMAVGLLDQALALHRGIGDRRNESETLGVLAEVHRDLGALPLARTLAQRGVRAAEDSQDARARVRTISVLATILVHLGQLDAGLAEHERAVRLAQEKQDRHLLASTLLDQADSRVRAGQTDVAFLDVCDALAVARQVGSWLVERRARRVLRLMPTDDEIDLLPRLADALRQHGPA